MMKKMLEIDSCYHLSKVKNGVCWGAGITKGSDGVTTDGDSVKAGKFPVLFYGNQYIENKKKDVRTLKRNSRIMRRLGVSLSNKNISYTNQGNSSSA